MGSQISRIEKEFILNSVMDNEIPVSLRGDRIIEKGHIQSIDEDFISIRVAGQAMTSFAPGTGVRGYFSYFGHVMMFNSSVRVAQGDLLRIDVPKGLYKNLSRKYERVSAPSDASVSFEIQNTKVELNFPKTEEYNPVEPPTYSDRFDPSRLDELVTSFRKGTEGKASTNSIQMFRDRGPDRFEERIISTTGKALFIPDTAGKLPENDFEIDGRIITRAMMLQSQQLGVDEHEFHDRLPSLLAEKRSSGIEAEIWCPLIYHQYVVGYVYLARKRGRGGAFDRELLDYTHQFCKVLVYALKINGYFKKAIPESSKFDCQIVDISASGLLFTGGSEELDSALPLYADIDMRLNLGPRSLGIGSRIMRKYRDRFGSYYGLQFMEIKPEDFRYLFEFIYGRVVTDEDRDLWEGGADPPEITFE